MGREFVDVGTVREVWRYPVKSMRGEKVESTKIGWHGLEADRRYAYVRVGNASGLPWLSAREFPQLIRYVPHFLGLGSTAEDASSTGVTGASGIVVTTPNGDVLPLESTVLRREMEARFGGPLNVMQLWRGTFDSMAVSMISTASIAAVGEKLGASLEVERFRPNIVIDAVDQRPFPEDRWVGELLVFGERDTAARIRAARKDLRCKIVNLDPSTAEENLAVLAEIACNRRNLLGIYGSTERPGTVCVGDAVRLARS